MKEIGSQRRVCSLLVQRPDLALISFGSESKVPWEPSSWSWLAQSPNLKIRCLVAEGYLHSMLTKKGAHMSYECLKCLGKNNHAPKKIYFALITCKYFHVGKSREEIIFEILHLPFYPLTNHHCQSGQIKLYC